MIPRPTECAWRRAARPVLALGLGISLYGCVLSQQPYYSDAALIAPPVADGNWRRLQHDGEPDQSERWLFTGNRVTALDDRGRWRSFEVRYFRAGDHIFVDTFPAEPAQEPSASEGYWYFHQQSYHLLARVEASSDRLILRPLTAPAFAALSKSGAVAAGRAADDYVTVIDTATPADWAAFLAEHADNDAVFKDDSRIVFIREQP